MPKERDELIARTNTSELPDRIGQHITCHICWDWQSINSKNMASNRLICRAKNRLQYEVPPSSWNGLRRHRSNGSSMTACPSDYDGPKVPGSRHTHGLDPREDFAAQFLKNCLPRAPFPPFQSISVIQNLRNLRNAPPQAELTARDNPRKAAVSVRTLPRLLPASSAQTYSELKFASPQAK